MPHTFTTQNLTHHNEVSDLVFKGAFTFKISTFKIHVDVFSATSRAHCPVVVHKPNRLPAIIARGSFFHHVKAHAPSIYLGYYPVSKGRNPNKGLRFSDLR